MAQQSPSPPSPTVTKYGAEPIDYQPPSLPTHDCYGHSDMILDLFTVWVGPELARDYFLVRPAWFKPGSLLIHAENLRKTLEGDSLITTGQQLDLGPFMNSVGKVALEMVKQEFTLRTKEVKCNPNAYNRGRLVYLTQVQNIGQHVCISQLDNEFIFRPRIEGIITFTCAGDLDILGEFELDFGFQDIIEGRYKIEKTEGGKGMEKDNLAVGN